MEIADWLDREGLIDKYQGMGLDTSKIEEADYIWDGRSYAELTGRGGAYGTDTQGIPRKCSVLRG